MIEMEYKYMLSETDFSEILDRLLFNYQPEIGININYYFDTPDLDLSKSGFTLRVRQIKSKLTLDLKMPGIKSGHLVKREEIVKEIKEFPFLIDLKTLPIQSNIAHKKVAQFIGTLVTERYSFRVKDEFIIYLDKSSYLGVLDYELEIEILPNFRVETYDSIQKVFRNIETSKILRGKKTRFINRLKNLQGNI